MCSQPKIIFFVFTAFDCICEKSCFSEKEMASLFKNGHFKNVQFRKTAAQIYSAFLYGNPFVWDDVHAYGTSRIRDRRYPADTIHSSHCHNNNHRCCYH